jgi:hypothetical protein
MSMASTPGSTNGGTPFPREPFTFPSFGNIGPPCIATLSLLGLTIGLPVWFFSTPVILNLPNYLYAPSASDVSTPPTHQPHVHVFPSSSIRSPSISPSSPSESSKASSQVDKKKKKKKEKKKKNQKGTKPPTTSSHVGSEKLATVNRIGSIDKVDKSKTKNLKPKFPCRICKGDHFLRDFSSLPKVLEMWSSTSLAPIEHVGDTPSTSDIKIGKKNRNVKFPFLLCEGDHYSHLCPHIDDASYLLEKIQLPTGDHKISSYPSLVDGLVNVVPSPIILVDQVVNMVSSSIEPLTKVVDLVPSLVNPTPPLKSATQVVDLVLPSIDPTPPLKSATQGGRCGSIIDRSHSSFKE